jgi:hypothetical protein
MSDHDRAGEFGPIYLPALQRIRDLWLELEPLVEATSYDDVVSPTELQISLTDGLGDADAARIDIQWSELGMYSFHTEAAWKLTALAMGGSASLLTQITLHNTTDSPTRITAFK